MSDEVTPENDYALWRDCRIEELQAKPVLEMTVAEQAEYSDLVSARETERSAEAN